MLGCSVNVLVLLLAESSFLMPREERAISFRCAGTESVPVDVPMVASLARFFLVISSAYLNESLFTGSAPVFLLFLVGSVGDALKSMADSMA